MKLIKDPLYGYVEIEDKYITLIDTAEFQRLRNIIQTSYQALYSSALHNRFVHSIGVFHLGKRAFSSFAYNVNKDFPNEYSKEWEKLKDTFLAACLLHDVGHSPFSHTGERFYKDDFRQKIQELLPGNVTLHQDIKNGTGKNHEAMSAIVGLQLLRNKGMSGFMDEELFIRCIIGVQYNDSEHLIENTIIGMLNGSLIDVDKLDYLIRDGYVTGFNTMALDVDRLFAGYTLADYSNSTADSDRVVAYKRGALSVIENVTFANDLERHWIQNHPTILYDAKLLELAIGCYDSFMKKKYASLCSEKTIFTQKSLSVEGYEAIPLSLLSDDDIVSYLKNREDKSLVYQILHEQYFERSKRLKPLWKSEAEFLHLERQLLGAEVKRTFKAALKAIKENTFFINDEEMQKAKDEKKTLEGVLISGSDEMKELARISLRTNDKIMNIFSLIKQFCMEHNLEFKFAYVFVEHPYESNYAKLMNSDIYIKFADKRVVPVRDILTVTSVAPTEDERNGYYYLYTSQQNIEIMREQGLDFAYEIIKYIGRRWDGSENSN